MLPLGFALRVRGRRWRVAAVAFLLGAIVLPSGIRSWPDQIGGRRPGNQTDEFYRYVAQQLNEPVLCDRIPWSVESVGEFFTEPSYERSECYDFIAGRTRNPWVCWKVKRLGAFSVLSNQTPMWTCLDHAVHGRNGGIAIAPSDLVCFFAQMGYEPGQTSPRRRNAACRQRARHLPAAPDPTRHRDPNQAREWRVR
jgi:hypothetical protein